MSPYRRRISTIGDDGIPNGEKAIELPPPDLVQEDRVASDAEPLELAIERRYKDLIAQSMHPKDLSAALAGAAKWVAIKRGLEAQEGWGEKLRETVSGGNE